jgi:hypothetical protein
MEKFIFCILKVTEVFGNPHPYPISERCRSVPRFYGSGTLVLSFMDSFFCMAKIEVHSNLMKTKLLHNHQFLLDSIPMRLFEGAVFGSTILCISYTDTVATG